MDMDNSFCYSDCFDSGLSSVAAHPWTASDYIQPLLQFASENIPPEKHKDTSLYIMATAGLRLLDVDTQNSILEDLRSDIPKNFSFRLASTNIEVISGKQEGIFQWIAINYVLGRFNHNSSRQSISNIIIAVLFASMQILHFLIN